MVHSGRLTTRNRKFLKRIEPYCSDTLRYTSDPIVVLDPVPGSDARLDSTTTDEPAVPGLEVEPHVIAVPAAPGHLEEPVEQLPRRSSRVRQVPDRLNIETTKGQSYKSALMNTACMSVSVSTTSFLSGLVGGKASMMMEDDCLAVAGTVHTVPQSDINNS